MDRVVSIKITSDGRAFVVDQSANAAAVGKLQEQLQAAGAEVDKFAAKATAAKQATMSWTEFVKANMGPAMKQFAAEGATHAEAHTKAIRQIAEQWKVYKQTGVDANKGVADAVTPLIPKLHQTEAGLARMGVSAAQSARNMRQVAPQITDIVTQIAAGQNPMQIFIQQGGQLKDVFGGVGPAARAVGSYVLGMVNPFTVAAGVVGGLAVAFALGDEESAKFTRQLLLSGNAAGATSSDYYQMAGSLAALAGTKGAALEALGEMAQGGRVSADQLQRFTGIAQQLDRLVGKPVADTAKEFVALGESPVAASLKLTQTYNHLTAAVYQQIKSLQDQGRETEAAKLAQDAFAQAFEERIPKMQANLGLLAGLWLEVKDAIAKTGDSLLNLGRAPTLQEQMATVRQQIAQAQGLDKNRPFSMPWDPKLPDLERVLANLEEQERSEWRSAAAAADRLATTQARGRFDKMAEDSLTKQEKLARAIAKAEADGAAAGASRAEIDKVIANEKKKHVDSEAEAAHQDALSARIARVRRANELEALLVKEGVQQIAAQYKLGLASYVEHVEQIGEAEARLLERQRDALAQEIAIAKQKKNSLQEVANLEGQLLLKEEEIAARRKKMVSEVANRQAELAKKADAFYAAEREKNKADLEAEGVAHDERYRAMQASVRDYVVAVHDESDELGFQISMMGKSAVEQAKLIELRRIALNLRQQERAIDRAAEGGKLTGEEVFKLKAEASAAAAQAAAEAGTRVWVGEWSRANAEVSEDLYLALTGRSKEAARRVENLFENLVLRPTIMGIMQPVSGAAASFLTGGMPAGAQSAAGSAVGSGFMTGAAGATASSWLGAGFGATMQNGLISGFGANMANISTLVSGGAYGTALSAALPYLGIALGAISLLKGAFKGETRSGGKYIGADFLEGPSGGEINGQASRDAISATQAGIAETLKALGATATLTTLHSGFESSERGKGFAYAGGQLSTGQIFGQTHGKGWENRRGSMTPEQAVAAFGEELKQATLQALQAADVSGILGDYLRELGDIDKLSGGALDAALNRITTALTQKQQLEAQLLDATSTELERMLRAREAERNALDESNRALYDTVRAATEKRTLEERLFDLIASDAEKLARTRELERAAVVDSNRALLEQIYRQEDLAKATEAATRAAAESARQIMDNVKNAAAMLSDARRAEAEQIRGTVTALDSSASRLRALSVDLRNFRDSMLLGDLSPLTPKQQYEEAARQFNQAVTTKDYEKISGAAQEFLRASQIYNASSDAYVADFARVQAALTISASQAAAAADADEAQAAIARAQLSALSSIDAGVASVADATRQMAGAIGAAISAGLNPGANNIAALTGGVTGQVVETGIGSVYASNRGAVVADGTIYGATTGAWTVDEAREILTHLITSGRTTEAYYAIERAGLTLAEAEFITTGQRNGSFEAWARAVGLPVFHDGIDSVPRTGLALLEAGEAVIPRRENLRGAGSDALLAEVRALTAEVRALKAQHAQATVAKIQAAVAAAERGAGLVVEGTAKANARAAFDRANAAAARMPA